MDWFHRTKKNEKKIVFSLDENNLFVAAMEGKKLLFSDQILLESLNSSTLSLAVEHLAEKHHLVAKKATLILPESRYQLLMTDKLPVAEAEMTNAIRWKMKGLLEFPINESTLDTFSVPSHGTGGKRNTVFVVATSKKFIQSCVEAFSKALVPLVRVDIAV